MAVAALVAAVLVPAASATVSATPKLALLPLPASALGSSASSLALNWGSSGAISNGDIAGSTFSGVSPATFKKMGRIGGYALDYGHGASGGFGITEVYMRVDQYKTSAGAKKGLAFWKKDDPKLAQLNRGNFAVTSKAQQVPAVGKSRFAFLASFAEANIVPVWSLDEQFADGRYELDVTVWAGSPSAPTTLAPQLAKKLDRRLHKALAGKLHAKPVKLPAKPQAGAPAGGPDLSKLALQPSDFSGTATVKDERYYPFVLSDFSVFMQPAGPFDLLDQEIEWYPTANEASFWSDWDTAQFLSGGGSSANLSGIGDGAQGVYYDDSTSGVGQVVFSSGRLAENIFVVGKSVQASDIQNLAQKAANYINNAGLGS